MADKIVKAVKKSRAGVWSAFKKGVSLQGYKYYDAPQEIKYRYPAPGSVALDEADKRFQTKLDWKTPYKNTNYYVRPTEPLIDYEDPAITQAYVSSIPQFDGKHPRFGSYDQAVLDSAIPELKAKLMSPELEVGSEALKEALWADWDMQAELTAGNRDLLGPGTADLEDIYNQENEFWRPRGATGFESNARMKNMFIELEYWIEEVVGRQNREAGKVATAKGNPKKWQILDDSFDRDQIEKLQAASDAPMPEQLEMWAEKHTNTYIQAPFNNANVQQWRDKPLAIDSAEFDPQLLGYDKEQKRRLFIERYERPKELTAGKEE